MTVDAGLHVGATDFDDRSHRHDVAVADGTFDFVPRVAEEDVVFHFVDTLGGDGGNGQFRVARPALFSVGESGAPGCGGGGVAVRARELERRVRFMAEAGQGKENATNSSE
jgi:hypothetical protein